MIYKDITETGKNVIDEEAINQAIKNLIETQKGEIPLRRDYGTRLPELLFEPYSFINNRRIYSMLISEITKFIPEIEVKQIMVEPADEETKKYYIGVFYEIKGLKTEGTFKKEY